MKKNEHQQEIPVAVLQTAQTSLNDLNALLSPYELQLTPDERRSMLVMGDKTLGFVEKAYEFAQQNPTLVPAYLDMAEFGIDKADATGLRTLLNTAQQVVEGIADTEMAAGSEAYHAALVFYNSVKVAAAQDVYGAKAVYDELKKRFPGSKRKSANTITEAE
jgi:hypothetical protein